MYINDENSECIATRQYEIRGRFLDSHDVIGLCMTEPTGEVIAEIWVSGANIGGVIEWLEFAKRRLEELGA